MAFDPLHNNYLSHAEWLALEEQDWSDQWANVLLLVIFAVFGVSLLVGGVMFMGWL